jgi:beta-lactamase superfamily II metal-dependent hydrolase
MTKIARKILPAVLVLVASAGAVQAAKTLEIYFIDVEGGQSTLIVSPSGQSLLIDTGYAGFSGRDADRIHKAAKDAGVKRIDYLMITHFHADHVGGVGNLLQRLPVGTFLDHGPSVETNSYPEPWAEAFAKGKHQVLAPGAKIPVKDLEVTVLTSGGKRIDNAGEPNPYCAGLDPRPEGQKGESGENPQSNGVLVQFGKFRFLDLGDITWNKELAVLCPNNHAGKVDLYLTTHHLADSPKAIWGLAPRVAIANNGPRKGGSAAGWKTTMASPGLEDMWQLHFAVAGGKDANVADTLIANVDEMCQGEHLKVSASEDGSFTVLNPRNKYSKTYKAR